jgi:hypothetical protein
MLVLLSLGVVIIARLIAVSNNADNNAVGTCSYGLLHDANRRLMLPLGVPRWGSAQVVEVRGDAGGPDAG